MKIFPQIHTRRIAPLNLLAVLILSVLFLVSCSSGGGKKSVPIPNKSPSTSLTATPKDGESALEVTFNATMSDPDGDSLTVKWDFGDGKAEDGGKQKKHTYQSEGTYTAKVTVSDGKGGSAVDSAKITVSAAPTTQHEGEWVWLLTFASTGIEFSGLLSVSVAIDDNATSRNVEGGAWRWCLLNPCESGIDGLGLIGEFKSSNKYELAASFADSTNFIKLIAIDSDNTMGTEVDNKPTFLGLGSWFFDSGGNGNIVLGMTKISDKPAITSGVTSLSINSIKFNPKLRNQSQPSGNFDYIINKLEQLAK